MRAPIHPPTTATGTNLPSVRGHSGAEEDITVTDETPFLRDDSLGSSEGGSKRVRFSGKNIYFKARLYGLLPRTAWQAVFEWLYGDSVDEDLIPMITWLSAILFVIIGGFWLLDSLKDTVFASIVGMQHQPWAKFCSVMFTLLLTLGYNAVVDRLAKPTLFYIVGLSYTIIFLVIAVMLADPATGIQNEEANPGRLLGWMSYLAIESYGSVASAMFWAFTNSSVHLEGAKSYYGLILAGAQVGAIFGSTLATKAEWLSLPTCYALGGVMPTIMAILIFFYSRVYGRLVPPETPRTILAKKTLKTDLFEGLRTVFQHPYVMALAGISCLYEIVLTILDYEMKVIGLEKLKRHPHVSEKFAELMGHFGQLTNGLSFFFSLFGTSYVVRQLGLPTTLRIFPCLLIVASIAAFLYPFLGVLFFFVSILKALSYALNEPCKEMLYIPTSPIIRFKAKSWIDVFGTRVAKAFGSVVTNMAKDNPDALVKIGSVPSWMISVILLLISIYMGRAFEELSVTREIVGMKLEQQQQAAAEDERVVRSVQDFNFDGVSEAGQSISGSSRDSVAAVAGTQDQRQTRLWSV